MGKKSGLNLTKGGGTKMEYLTHNPEVEGSNHALANKDARPWGKIMVMKVRPELVVQRLNT